jgi:choline kinase
MKNKRFIHKIKSEINDKTTFIILCAKKSNRKGYKNVPLTLINNETLIDHQINIINKNYGESDIIIVSGFEQDKLINHIHSKKYPNVRIAENQNYKMSSVLDGWRMGLNLALRQDTYIIHGDRIFDESCIINEGNKNTHILIHDVDKNNYDFGLSFEGNKFVNISYGLPNVWSEIFFINKSDFNVTRNLINNCSEKKIHSIDSFINFLSTQINISILKKKPKDIKLLKEFA